MVMILVVSLTLQLFIMFPLFLLHSAYLMRDTSRATFVYRVIIDGVKVIYVASNNKLRIHFFNNKNRTQEKCRKNLQK